MIDFSSGGILSRAPAGAVNPAHGYQAPYARQIWREAGVLATAVGLIVHVEQAEHILQAGSADLIAFAREMLYDPNGAMDAAPKLALDAEFALVPPPHRYWLARRAASLPEARPSTFTDCAGTYA